MSSAETPRPEQSWASQLANKAIITEEVKRLLENSWTDSPDASGATMPPVTIQENQ